MKTIKLIARGLVSGQVRLTPELLEALRQIAQQSGPGRTTVVTITEELAASSAPVPDAVPRGLRFGRLVSGLALPPRRRCTPQGAPLDLPPPDGPMSL